MTTRPSVIFSSGPPSRRIANVLTFSVACACGFSLLLSFRPGLLADLLFVGTLFSCCAIPGGLLGLAIAAFLKLRLNLPLPAFGRRHIATVAALILASVILICFDAVPRVGFAVSRKSFEAQIPNAAPSDSRGKSLRRRLGLYYIDQFASDPRGGTYFRTRSTNDGIGPDLLSFGFAHKPNPKGSPFGNARYHLTPLGYDWYLFQASDDW